MFDLCQSFALHLEKYKLNHWPFASFEKSALQKLLILNL